MLTASPLYAGLLALLLIVLSARVVQGRFLHKVSVGDKGDPDMLKRMRVQANFVEYAPVGLILLILADLQGMPEWLVHLFGAALVAGRCLHAWGLGRTPQVPLARRLGMYLTVAVIGLLAIGNIAYGI